MLNHLQSPVTQTEARIFKPATAKGAHKEWDNVFCDSAQVTECETRGFALVGVFGDGTTRAYSIPALKELGVSRLPMLDKTRMTSAIVTPSGDIFGWTGPSEIAMLGVWGAAQPLPKSQDKLYNPQALIPPRPTISNLQWISGTQYVSPTDLDILIGGPDRPPSKRMLAAAAEEDRLARQGGGAGPSHAPGTRSTEGWGDYMTRQLNERTEKLNIMGDSMDKAQENSQGWADDVSKFVSKQKRNMILGGLTGKWL
jgi:syntaxin-binding protein 5